MIKTGNAVVFAVVGTLAVVACGFAVFKTFDGQGGQAQAAHRSSVPAVLDARNAASSENKHQLLASILAELEANGGHATKDMREISARLNTVSDDEVNPNRAKKKKDKKNKKREGDSSVTSASKSSGKKRRRNRRGSRDSKKKDNNSSKKRRRNRRGSRDSKKKDNNSSKKRRRNRRGNRSSSSFNKGSKIVVQVSDDQVSAEDEMHRQLEADLRAAELTARNAALQARLDEATRMLSTGETGSVNAKTNCTKSAPSQQGVSQMLPEGTYPMQPVSDPELQKHIYFLSCMGVDQYDRLVLSKHIIKYFQAMGVLNSNFVLIIQARYNLTGVQEMWQWLEAEGIQPRDIWVGPYSSTDLHAHRLRVLQPLNLTKDDWIVHADQDDFHEYPMPLVEFLGEMNRLEIDVVKGKFVDRFATRDCRALPTVSHDSSVFQQYPHCSGNFTKKLVGGNPKKVVLYRGNLRTNRGGHKITNLDEHIVELMRDPDRTNTSQARALNAYGGGPLVHHMKWSSSVLDRLIDRKVRYKLRDGHNGTHWREAARAIAYFTRDYEELADEGLGEHSFLWAKASTQLCDEWVAERKRLTEKAMKEANKDMQRKLAAADNDAEEEEEEEEDQYDAEEQYEFDDEHTDDDFAEDEDDEEAEDEEEDDEDEEDEDEEDEAAMRAWIKKRRQIKERQARTKRSAATRPRRPSRKASRRRSRSKRSAGRL